MAKPPRGESDSNIRRWLAPLIVIGGMVAIVAISVAVVWAADNRETAARWVFAGVVPLFSTWVGAVIAYYFTRAGLEAATESTLKLTGALTPESPVTAVMIPRAKITSHDLKEGEQADDVALADLVAEMSAVGRHRIPILDQAGAVVYVVHDSTINANTAAVKVGDLPDEAKQALGAIGTVGPAAVVKDARAAMAAVPGCNDVFVTQAGQRTDPILGWLTNTDLAGIQ